MMNGWFQVAPNSHARMVWRRYISSPLLRQPYATLLANPQIRYCMRNMSSRIIVVDTDSQAQLSRLLSDTDDQDRVSESYWTLFTGESITRLAE